MMRGFLILFVFVCVANAFTIESYQSQVTVNEDGSITVYENMIFTLEQEYREGYRSIRKEDFGSLSDIAVNSVTVNGQDVNHKKQMAGDKAEIVWLRTHAGENVVELNYSISDRVQLYNDFAKLCFEHYGANWDAPARSFVARTTPPPEAAGKTVHFEVYSRKKGDAYIDGRDIVIEIEQVPSGNYVGGCYLFDRGAVQTTNAVDASAYDILKNEREIYGSVVVLEGERPWLEWCCVPVFLLFALVAAYAYLHEKKRPRLPESLLPPGEEEPAVVTALVRNRYEIKELVAAVIVDLINRGIIDIVELEKKGEAGSEIRRERTILMLKKVPEGLKDYERSVVEFVFGNKKEVDLDMEMAACNLVSDKTDASKLDIVKRMNRFRKDFPKQIEKLFKDSEIKELSNSAEGRKSVVIGATAILAVVGFFVGFAMFVDSIGWYAQHGEFLSLGAIAGSLLGTVLCGAYLAYVYARAKVPKKEKNRRLYGVWDAFYRGLKSSRIKEYPPASAVIWGRILVYAAALGMAEKVKAHLSEIDSALAERLEKVDGVAITTMSFYSSTVSVRNLATYGNRSGRVSGGGKYGSYSSYSSGGWSGGGGGGFSGGSSGGGGFR